MVQQLGRHCNWQTFAIHSLWPVNPSSLPSAAMQHSEGAYGNSFWPGTFKPRASQPNANKWHALALSFPPPFRVSQVPATFDPRNFFSAFLSCAFFH